MEGGIMTAVQTSNPVHDAEGAVEAGIHEVGATSDAVEREVGRGVSTRFPLNSAFIFTFGALGGMLFGFDTGIISGASPLIESDFGLSVAQTGFITSSVLIGSCAGALSIGALSDRFGRKKLLILAAILFLLGSGMCAGSTGFLMMVVARIILGLAVGAASSLTPAYLAELAPKERRGSLSTLFQLMITFGILLAYASNLGFLGHNIAGIRDWRWMLGSALVPAALLLIGGLLLPESPRYLVSRGKDREAFKVLTLIRKDVDQTQWYHNAVDYVLGNDLMKGTGKTTFSPDATLTRGMVVTVLGRAAGVKTSDYTGTSFSDVKAGSWYAPYVQWASKQGLVKGYEDGTFKPEQNVTREEMVTMLFRCSQSEGNTWKTDVAALNANKDSAKVSSWALPAMRWAAANGVVNGVGDSMLEPQGQATRAQFAKIIMVYLENLA